MRDKRFLRRLVLAAIGLTVAVSSAAVGPLVSGSASLKNPCARKSLEGTGMTILFRPAGTKKPWICEFRIPLAPSSAVPGGIGVDPGATVRASFNWGGVERKTLSTRSSREAPSSQSGYVSGTGRTWGQEFLDTFDAMSRPTTGTEKYAYSVDLKLAGKT
ncbi:MAG: hypothetical protein ABSG19_13545 [Candidatus Aminicenantales bacterium]